MTTAAETLHLTQSGVSQHIKALEEDLGIKLFTRSGRKLIPTPAANQIYPDLADAFTKVTSKISDIKGTSREPSGFVRVGMPIEFGNNVIIGRLSSIGQKLNRLTFEITLDHALVLNQKVIAGELDFAYIDETPRDRRLNYEAVGFEHLQLCASQKYMNQQSKVTYSQSFFESLEYIEYTGTEPILRRWMFHHLKRKNMNLNVRAHIMDVQGVGKFISTGLGVGVLPDHVVKKLGQEGIDLYVFEGRRKPLRNEIRLVRLKDHILSHGAQATIDLLRQSF